MDCSCFSAKVFRQAKTESPPSGVPPDLQSAVKNVRPIKAGGFVIPQYTRPWFKPGCCGLQIRRS